MADSAAESMSPDPTQALSFLFLVKGLEFVSYSCVSVFLPRACTVPVGAKRGRWIPWSRSWGEPPSVSVGTEFGAAGQTVSTLGGLVISPAVLFFFFFFIIFAFVMPAALQKLCVC